MTNEHTLEMTRNSYYSHVCRHGNHFVCHFGQCVCNDIHLGIEDLNTRLLLIYRAVCAAEAVNSMQKLASTVFYWQ